MARLLVHQQEIRDQFPDGAVWVTVGEDATGPELANKVTNTVWLLSGDRPPLTDPLAAGAELGRALGDRRVLLIIDDVWTAAQTEPFLLGGPAAVRLFTTRVRGVLPQSAERVKVDEMDRSEAAQLLNAGIGEVSGDVVAALLVATGRWPVLLTLVNGAVRADHNAGCQAEDSMREILYELSMTGPTVLDITDADERHAGVARTIGVSLTKLTAEQRSRYLELAVFGEDVAIPVPVLARYWEATGGWSQVQTRSYCRRLADLALVSDYRRDPDQVALHDIIRAYLREQTRHQHEELNNALIDAHRGLVPKEGETSAWWQLSGKQTYLWAWLPAHLRDAGLDQELQACLHHPQWLVGKLEHVGPAGLEADLAMSDDPLSRALETAVRQNAHVLGPLQPPGSLAATLATRLLGDDPTRAIAEELITRLTTPHLRAITALPDLPHPALSRILTGHTGEVRTLAVSPDGSWLAASSHLYGHPAAAEVRIWNPATGAAVHTFTGPPGLVLAMVVAPDGSWLASASYGGTIRIWDPATGTVRHTLTGHTGHVQVLAVAPDGSWLASTGGDQFADGEVRIWDPADGTERHILTGHAHPVWALAVAPDGSWLASASRGEVRIWNLTTKTTSGHSTLTTHSGEARALKAAPDGSWLASASGKEVRIWNPATGTADHTLKGHTREVWPLVIAPDGSWLASADGGGGVVGGEVRIWDPATGSARHILSGHTRRVVDLTVAPDGSWLASTSSEQPFGSEIRIWDTATWTARHTLTGHSLWPKVVAPDGSWLAFAGDGGEVRIWDPVIGNARHILTGHAHEVRALTVAPDGSWLASAGKRELRIWDPLTGTVRHTLTGHTHWVLALAVAPDGSWLTSTSDDGTIRIWDPLTGTARYTLTGHTSRVNAWAVPPDGSWLASTSDDGTIRIWDPLTGAPLASLRVSGRLSRFVLASTTIAAAGEHGVYFLALRHGARSKWR